MVCIVTAHIALAYIVMACKVMAYTARLVMVCIFMAVRLKPQGVCRPWPGRIVTAYIVMAYIVMAGIVMAKARAIGLGIGVGVAPP